MKVDLAVAIGACALLTACGGPSDTDVEKASRSFIEGSGHPVSGTKNLGCQKAKPHEVKVQGGAYFCNVESTSADGSRKSKDTLVLTKQGEVWYAQK